MDAIKKYFLNLSSNEKLIWGCAGILLLKCVLGDSKVGGPAYSSQAVFMVYTGGIAFWGVALYAVALLAIRMGWLKAYIAEKKSLLILYVVYSAWLAILAFSIELRGSQIQFVLSAAVIGLQFYAYSRLA